MGSDVGAPRASTPRGLAARLKMFLPLIFCFLAISSAQNQEAEESELLEGSESQNYGYGYGTKVDGPHGSSTVYVHGFGTDDSYHPAPAHHGYGGVHNGYGYGHIDPYLNAKHGYGFSNGYGYNQVHGYNGYHGPRHGAHHGHHDVILDIMVLPGTEHQRLSSAMVSGTALVMALVTLDTLHSPRFDVVH